MLLLLKRLKDWQLRIKRCVSFHVCECISYLYLQQEEELLQVRAKLEEFEEKNEVPIANSTTQLVRLQPSHTLQLQLNFLYFTGGGSDSVESKTCRIR